MRIADVLSTNLGRARRLIVRPNRLERAKSFVAWQRYLSAQRRLRGANRRRDLARRANQSLLQRELREEATVLASHPTTLSLDPASLCNLRCPFCPTGAGFGEFPRTLLSEQSFARIMRNLRVDLIQRVELYNWGEPLLNPQLPEFIRFFAERHAETEVSTNFSQRDYDETFLASLVESGLSSLIVSVDGATQSTYERYRVRGDLGRVLGNMTRLAAVRKTLGKATPLIHFKMLLNRHNEHEVEEARRLADACGAVFLLNEKFWCPDDQREAWVPDRASPPPEALGAYTVEPQDVISTYCRQLWESVIVTASGDVHPCCLTYEAKHAIGNLERDDVMTIRNGPRAVSLRRLVTGADAPAPPFSNACEDCSSRWCKVRPQPEPL